MYVEKKTSASDWFFAYFIIVLAEIPIFWLADARFLNPYVAWIVGVVALIVLTYLVVLAVMYLYYKKSFNFYTSKRFKGERKVVAGIGIVLILLWLIIVMDGLIRGIPITVDDLIVLDIVPMLVFVIYYILYMYAYIFRIRKPYYDDVLDK
ncbi:hypothetical protein MsAg5_13250 [Methanosarcinaceae archaeon Ag5]|uniref:Uncharacterized protein n=2 Tax=Methanolapillus africanus TaxID=3028297 RepID=A0AAE4MJS7_9EURY|nr:hypothetical protein [Methanosarcinaceae archaeon Ag5]